MSMRTAVDLQRLLAVTQTHLEKKLVLDSATYQLARLLMSYCHEFGLVRFDLTDETIEIWDGNNLFVSGLVPGPKRSMLIDLLVRTYPEVSDKFIDAMITSLTEYFKTAPEKRASELSRIKGWLSRLQAIEMSALPLQ